MLVVRYADDTVVGFEHRADAERFLQDLRQRMAKFALDLHPEKTRLTEFGKRAAANRRPSTFSASPTSADARGAAAFCCCATRGASR
jgi:hypothetical protein